MMFMKNKRTVLSLIASLAVTTAFAGGGWPQPRGTGFFKLGQNSIIADSFFQPNGDITSIRTISLFTTSFYVEYGLTDRLTTVAYIPFFVRSTLNREEFTSGRAPVPGDFVNSFGDTNLGVKYGLVTDGPVVVSVGLTLGVPLGTTAGGETGILQTGDGEFNQLVTVEASRSFGALYATALLGFNNRTENFSEELRYGLEVGYTFAEKLLVQLRMFGIDSFENGDARGGGANSIFANDTEFLSLTPEVAYNITDQWGVSVSMGTALSGKRILADPNYGMGVYFKW